jgi:hypothetical protein
VLREDTAVNLRSFLRAHPVLAAVAGFLIVNLVVGGYFVIARDYRVDWTTVAYLVIGTATFAAGTAHQSRRKPRN